MKALSLKQPFAELILQGKKTIELRTWNTYFRGPFLIHASKTVDRQAMKKWGFQALPTGEIVGKAMLSGVKKYTSQEEHTKDKHYHCASSDWGSYGFILTEVQRLPRFPCKGKLNFWESTYPNP